MYQGLQIKLIMRSIFKWELALGRRYKIKFDEATCFSLRICRCENDFVMQI